MRARGCVPVKSPKVTFGWKCGFARKCADAGLAEAGGRRAMLAELAESGLDAKKSVMILFVKSIPEQDKRKANNNERESHARKAVCGKSARTV